MLLLGLESSCDETAAALVRDGKVVLSSRIASQTKIHEVFGGVVPEVAAREHLTAIDPLVHAVLAEGGVKLADVDAIAVTQGPGLIGALLVGIAYAKGLALALRKPLVPVDHVHAHIHGALLGVNAESSVYPCLALVVSGGHTNLYVMDSPTSFQLVAASADDACGESFDKVAKLLGLGYPGGPHVERRAVGGDATRVAMPRMIDRKAQLEFSYSGLKTHVSNLVNQAPKPFPEERIPDVCAAFQEEALGQIVRKIKEALRRWPATRSVLVAGGVAANKRFRVLMAAEVGVPTYFPDLAFCSDNAAMIAAYGHHVHAEGRVAGRDFRAHDWDAYSRYEAFHAPA